MWLVSSCLPVPLKQKVHRAASRLTAHQPVLEAMSYSARDCEGYGDALEDPWSGRAGPILKGILDQQTESGASAGHECEPLEFWDLVLSSCLPHSVS